MCLNSFKMKKRKITQYMDIEQLRRLENDPTSCVEKKKFEHHLSLYPAQLSDLKSSIKYLLNNSLGKYDKRKEGILLGYEKVRVLRQEGDINYDTCFIHIDADVDFFIFKPNIGLIVNGVVNKTCSTHIGCLIHNMFNISVLRPSNDKNWIGQKVVLRNEVKIRITGLQLESRLPYITGEIISILSEDSGISTGEETGPSFNSTSYEDIKPNKNQSSPNKKHKQRNSGFELMEDSPNIKIKTEVEDTNDINFKKRKIKREVEESGCSFEDETNLFATVTVEDDGQVKKKRRSKSVCSNIDGYAEDVPLKTEIISNECTLDSNESNVSKIKRTSKSSEGLESMHHEEPINVHHESDVMKDRKQRKKSKSHSKHAPSDHVNGEPEGEHFEKRIRCKSFCREISKEQNVERKKFFSDYELEENDLGILMVERMSPKKELSPSKKSINIQNNTADQKGEELARKKKRKLHELSNEGEIIIGDIFNQSTKRCKSEKFDENENHETVKMHRANSKDASENLNKSEVNNEGETPKRPKKKHRSKEHVTDEEQVNLALDKKHNQKSKNDSSINDTSHGSLSSLNVGDLFENYVCSPTQAPMADDVDKGKKYTRSPHTQSAIVIDTSVAFPEDTDLEEILNSCKKKKKKHKRAKRDLDEDVVVKVEDLQDSQNLFQQLE